MNGEDTKTAGVVGGAILAILSVYWGISTFAGVEETFSAFDLIAFSAVAVSVTLLEILLVFLLSRFDHSLFRVRLVTAVLITINAYCLNLVFVENFMALKGWRFLPLAAGVFIAFTVVRIASESKGFRISMFAMAVILIGTIFVPASLWKGSDGKAAAVHGNDSDGTASPIIRKVAFVSRPNVYFIGFESAAPDVVLEKYLSLKDAPLPRAFEQNGFRVFKNAFAEAYATSNSYNMLMSMEKTYYGSLKNGNRHLFQGGRPSPLLQIFSANGYETNTLYNLSFFGKDKGEHVDNYLYNQEFSVCNFMERKTKKYAFFGACRLRESSLFPKRFKKEGPPIDFLMEYLQQVASRTRPQLLIAHLPRPVHTPSRGRYHGTKKEIDRFRSEYEKSSREAAEYLARIKGFIASKDPDSIIFAFGDHGVALSRNIRFEADPEFYVQDRYGVVAGIFPPGACSDSLNAPPPDGYLTTNEISRRIVQCLAGGADPFVAPYKHVGIDGDREIDFKDYIYE